MTTTLQAHGGGAQPASIDTSGKVAGGAAQRVYGFDSVEAAQAAGYVCEGGPAMSVALITDAQIASGEWKAEGDPAALVVYTAPTNMPVEGGYAVPVYPVNGWGSSTPVTLPDVSSATRLLDLRASQLALSDGDPVSTWPDASGNGRDFTQSGSSRPTYRAGGGMPYVEFDGIDDWMIGGNWSEFDNQSQFAVFCVALIDGNTDNLFLLSKFTSPRGWYLEGVLFEIDDTFPTKRVKAYFDDVFDIKAIYTGYRIGNDVHVYLNGDNTSETVVSDGTVSTISNTSSIVLAANIEASAKVKANFYAVLFYQITDTINWPADRAAIETWLATNP